MVWQVPRAQGQLEIVKESAVNAPVGGVCTHRHVRQELRLELLLFLLHLLIEKLLIYRV